MNCFCKSAHLKGNYKLPGCLLHGKHQIMDFEVIEEEEETNSTVFPLQELCSKL